MASYLEQLNYCDEKLQLLNDDKKKLITVLKQKNKIYLYESERVSCNQCNRTWSECDSCKKYGECFRILDELIYNVNGQKTALKQEKDLQDSLDKSIKNL